MEMSKNRSNMRWIEIGFDFIYLFIVFVSAIILYKTAEIGNLRWKFALMTFLLGGGDSFHLVPRIATLLDNKGRDYTIFLGMGKFITSITMTIFYLFLWEIGKEYYNYNISNYISIIVYGLAFLRIGLCFFPHNQWTAKKPSIRWGIIRNIPFLLLGSMVMTLFLVGALNIGGSLSYLWLAILISFVCYMPVVLYAQKKPMVGMLMLPKSCAYVAIVLMGFYM